jgi:GNAT superfamily N-acetyltransferase
MVKFCKQFVQLDPQIVGRKKSVNREVKLLCKEYDGELTEIKSKMWPLHSRTFVSLYSGRICVAALVMNKKKRGDIWHVGHAVVDKRARRKGLGKFIANCAMRVAFAHGCKQLYLGAELIEVNDDKIHDIEYSNPNETPAVLFWRKMRFKKCPHKEYNKVFRGDYEGLYPMKMTRRTRAVKELPEFEDIVDELFPQLEKVSKQLDGKKRTPMVRLCTPEMGDIKIYKNSKNNPHMVIH